MASMELTTAQQQEDATPEPADYMPRYAVSEIYLNDEALTALGLETPLPLGTVIQVIGTARVVSGSQREESDGEADNCMSIQLTDLEVRPTKKAVNVKAMFPNSKMEA